MRWSDRNWGRAFALAALLGGFPFAAAVGQDEEPAANKSDTMLRVSDVIALNRTGGSLSGELKGEYKDPTSDKTMLALLTPSGGQILLEKSRVARAKVQTDLVCREYEEKLAGMPDTAEEHFRMIEWLKAAPGGASKFAPQIRYHWRRIVELDPNDEAARKAVGLERVGNAWVDREALMASMGYVKDGSRWRSILELKLNEVEQQREAETRAGIAAWSKLKTRFANESPQALRAGLLTAMTPAIAAALREELGKETDPSVRRLLLEGIGTQRDANSANALLAVAIADPDPALRDLALNLLEQPGFDRDFVCSKASEDNVLQNKSNAIINRGAAVLGQIGSGVAVLPLIKALQTEHEITLNAGQEGRTNAGINSQGGAGLSLPGGPTKVRQKLQNQEVAIALRAITGTDFGFDQGRWMRWYRETFTISSADLRRDP